ncbi:Uncharacterised protein [Vibrio cholerae]|nr:Uncharacterised protein [Vibrio cholerae]CSI62672.1 Uncharacterised protein [Vibrio cholerae]
MVWISITNTQPPWRAQEIPMIKVLWSHVVLTCGLLTKS